MARTEGSYPDVPLKYRGIEVCEYIAYRWNVPEGEGWRMGIDQALEAVTEAAESLCKELDYGSDAWFPSEWVEGRDAGKEAAAEEIRDMMNTYKKESK